MSLAPIADNKIIQSAIFKTVRDLPAAEMDNILLFLLAYFIERWQMRAPIKTCIVILSPAGMVLHTLALLAGRACACNAACWPHTYCSESRPCACTLHLTNL